MKIAVFTDIYLEVAGGIPSSIRAQKKSLEALGHTVVVFCPGFRQPKDDMVVIVPTCRNLKINDAPTARWPEEIEEFVVQKYPDFRTFDVVHVHYEAGCGIAGMRLARKFGLPLVVTMHGREDMAIATNVPHPFKDLAGKTLNKLHAKYIPHRAPIQIDDDFADTLAKAKMWEMMVSHANYADIVLTPSMHFAKKLRKYGMIKSVMPLSNGVDDEMEKIKLTSRELKLGEPLRIIWNSRLSKEKRILPFLEALKDVKGRYELQVFGTGNQDAKARKFVEQNRLNVKFHGSVGRVKIFKAMEGAHVSVMASYGFDTQGMTLLESEAMGLPVMFCDLDMKEIVPEGSYKCASGPEPAKMAAMIDEIIKKPEWVKEASEAMIKNRKEVMQANQTRKLLKIYELAIKRRES